MAHTWLSLRSTKDLRRVRPGGLSEPVAIFFDAGGVPAVPERYFNSVVAGTCDVTNHVYDSEPGAI